MKLSDMWVEGLTKEERELASIFHPEDWVGEYVKLIVTRKYVCGDIKEEIAYYKLSEYSHQIGDKTNAEYRYKGLEVRCSYGDPAISIYPIIWPNYKDTIQCEIVPITREEFINGCKSLLPENIQELVNWDKV